jgi:hypothetical protein
MGSGTRQCGAYSKLSLLAVETCKVDWSPISITEDLGLVVQRIGVNRDRAQRVRRGLHANLTVFSCISDHKRASVLGRRMMGAEMGR